MKATLLIVTFLIGISRVFGLPLDPPSWTPPPQAFDEEEWISETPSWSSTVNERHGTLIWFYNEMTPQQALPVLLRALTHGETWLQAEASGYLNSFYTSLPSNLLPRFISFYRSIDIYGENSDEEPTVRELRVSLKFSILEIIEKYNFRTALELLNETKQETTDPKQRIIIDDMIRELQNMNAEQGAAANPYPLRG